MRVVLAGSIPSSMSSDTYMNIMRQLKDRGIMFVVDATSKLLMNVLPYRPFLIKPKGPIVYICAFINTI